MNQTEIESNLDETNTVSIPIAFVSTTMPVLFANVFVVQQQQRGDFVLTIGQAVPLLLGTTEEQKQQARDMGSIPVTTIARVVLTRGRLDELITILQGAIKPLDETKEGE